jgi:dTDP-4-dehydrorhamnose 3,5-epimerase-like enzyme
MTIHDVRVVPYSVNPDDRGSLSTIFSDPGPQRLGSMRQWNRIVSHANVLRGLHAHLGYDELYIPISGRMYFLLKDARRSSPSFGAEMGFYADAFPDSSILVPIGVAHGVYFETDGILLYGLSNAYDGRGELACRWNDRDIRSPWPATTPLLSEKDTSAGSFREMAAAIELAVARAGS